MYIYYKMNFELIQQFDEYVNKQEKPWMYKLLCIFGKKKFLRFQHLDKKHHTHFDMQYRSVYKNIGDFIGRTKCPDATLSMLRQYYIREIYLK